MPLLPPAFPHPERVARGVTWRSDGAQKSRPGSSSRSGGQRSIFQGNGPSCAGMWEGRIWTWGPSGRVTSHDPCLCAWIGEWRFPYGPVVRWRARPSCQRNDRDTGTQRRRGILYEGQRRSKRERWSAGFGSWIKVCWPYEEVKILYAGRHSSEHIKTF